MSNPIQIRNTIIGTGRPKICIPLVDETLEGLERSAAALRAFPCDLVEWRADFFEKEADPVCRKEALSLLRELLPGTPLLFTIRTKEEGGMYQKDRAEYVRAILEVIRETPGVSAKPTEGGSYLFVTIPELEVSLHQFIRIVREMANVIVTPGTEFGPQYLHQFRINFSQDKENAVAAMKRLFAIMDRYRKQA